MAEEKIAINKKIKIFGIVFILAAVFLQFWKYHWTTAEVLLKDQHLKVLIAKTIYQQTKGLGGRYALAPYDGMLFMYQFSRKEGFVMRDMKFPIDIVWLDKGVVVDIAPKLQPENVPEEQLRVYYPRAPANLVLELPAGWAMENGLKIGDTLAVEE